MYVFYWIEDLQEINWAQQDKLIIDFIPRVIPNVQQLLISTKQRLGIIPGPSTMDSIKLISDTQDALRRKVPVL